MNEIVACEKENLLLGREEGISEDMFPSAEDEPTGVARRESLLEQKIQEGMSESIFLGAEDELTGVARRESLLRQEIEEGTVVEILQGSDEEPSVQVEEISDSEEFIDEESMKESIAESLERRRPFNETTTLLEKAIYFRERFPEKFAIRQLQLQREYVRSLGIYVPDPFLLKYREEKRLKYEEKLQRLKEDKNAPPGLKLKIRFDTPATVPDFHALCEALEDDEDASIFEKEEALFGVFRSPSKNQINTLLTITICKGKNLLKFVGKTNERITKAKVKLTKKGDLNKNIQEERSSHRYVNTDGNARWGHKFVFKGSTKEELLKLRLQFLVKGRNDHEVSQLCKGSVACSSGFDAPENVSVWKQCLENPGQDIKFVLNLCATNRIIGAGGILATITEIAQKITK